MWRTVKRYLVTVLALAGLAGGAAHAVSGQTIKIGQPAPEITGGPWINSTPLTLSGLRGRVALVEFWTYG